MVVLPLGWHAAPHHNTEPTGAATSTSRKGTSKTPLWIVIAVAGTVIVLFVLIFLYVLQCVAFSRGVLSRAQHYTVSRRGRSQRQYSFEDTPAPASKVSAPMPPPPLRSERGLSEEWDDTNQWDPYFG